MGIQKYLGANKVKFTMSGIQQKSNRHSKKQKNVTYNEENNQSIKTYTELTQMLELAGTDIKRVIITIF